MPDAMRFWFGSFMDGKGHGIELSGEKLLYRQYILSSKAEREIRPSEQQWQAFKLELDEIDVWKWDESYDNPLVIDGTQWYLMIKWGGGFIETSGSNLYPAGDKKKSYLTRDFRALLCAIERLLGGIEILRTNRDLI